MKKQWMTLMAAALMLSPAAGVSAQGIGALGDFINSGAIKDVIEEVAAEVIDFSIIGSWTYKGSAVRLESDNKLADIGSTALTSGMESKVDGVLAKVGIKPGGVTMMFDDDQFCVMKIGQREIKGSYEYDAASETLKLRLLKIAPLTCKVEVRASDFALLFEVDALLKLIKGIGGAVNIDAIKSITGLLDNYQGMKIGMTFAK